ncbi:hypothetical protein GCM10027535_03050 [Mycolicibacterium hippocampi]
MVSAEARRRRDETVVRLHGLGWSLRRIARDPRVRLASPSAVRNILRQAGVAGPDEAQGPGDGLVLDWYRGAYVDGDPVAAEFFTTYKARMRQLQRAWAVERFGCTFDELDVEAGTALRQEAGGQAAAELAKVARSAGE